MILGDEGHSSESLEQLLFVENHLIRVGIGQQRLILREIAIDQSETQQPSF